jgi:glucose 1-dehydrogenase
VLYLCFESHISSALFHHIAIGFRLQNLILFLYWSVRFSRIMTDFKDRKKKGNIGRVVIVTGSGKGIGKSIAKEFAENGYSVILNARDESELKESAKEIMGQTVSDGNNIISISGDVSKEENCKSLIDGAISRFGRVDVLVNNAGIKGASKKITDLTTGEWSEVMDINLKSTFFCTREVLKHMLKKNVGNSDIDNNFSIINISSVHESLPQPESVPYAASKGGMQMFTKTVALDVAESGIRVNGIAPGTIDTDVNKEVLDDEHKKKQEEQNIPLQRIGKPDEVAKVALFLASSDASYITGTTIYVDGGMSLTS